MARQRGEKEQRKIICVRASQGKNVGLYILPLTKCLDFPFRVVRYEKRPTENFAGCRENKTEVGKLAGAWLPRVYAVK